MISGASACRVAAPLGLRRCRGAFESLGTCRRTRPLEHVSPGSRPPGASRGRWRGGGTMLKGHAFILVAGAALIALDASASLAQDTTRARPHSTKRIPMKKEAGEVAP